jgi:Tfp pilus assembly protein PilO
MDLSTPAATKVAGVVGLLAVAALGWNFAVSPETGRLNDARAEVTSIQDQNALLTTQLAGLQKQQAELGTTRRLAHQLARRFPATADQPGLFEMVTAAAIDSGIGAKGVTTLTPTPPIVASADGTTPGSATATPAAPTTSGAAGTSAGTPAPGQLAQQTVTVAVTGSYDQTQQLLVNLEHMKRAYLIDSVSLAGDAGVYTTTITGQMFVMPPVEGLGKTLDVSSTTTDPEGDS